MAIVASGRVHATKRGTLGLRDDDVRLAGRLVERLSAVRFVITYWPEVAVEYVLALVLVTSVASLGAAMGCFALSGTMFAYNRVAVRIRSTNYRPAK